MKLFLSLAPALLLVMACSSPGSKPTSGNDQQADTVTLKPGQETTQPGEYTIKGIVKKIEPGKDGYTATLLLDNGTTATALVSIVNLQRGNSPYRMFHEGDTARLTGDTMRLGEQLHLVVRHIPE